MSESASAATVTDRVTGEIRRAILAGRLRPGQEFSLRQIAGQLGVSFIPVREALRSLEAEGLLVVRRGRRAVVAPLDQKELHGLCQLRRRIEPDLAAESCRLTTSSRLDELDSRICQARAADHPDERFDAYRALLADLLGPAATPWDLRMLRVLWCAGERYLRLGCALRDRAGIEVEQFDAVQHELVAGYRGRDPERARAATLRHLEWAEQVGRLGLGTC